VKRKRSQPRKHNVRRKTRSASKRVVRGKRTSRAPKVNSLEDRRHRKQLGPESRQTSRRSQNKSSDPEQGLSSKPTEESRQISQKNPEQVKQTGGELFRMVRQLEVWSREPDLTISRTAFEALAAVLHEVLAWLWMMSLLPDASLGALLRQLPSDDAWKRYRRGEHVAAWAGVELARLYKRIRAELWSRSKDSVNRLRDLRLGLQVGTSDPSPNEWFCAEYKSRADYRPTGKMAVWIARKIEEVRSLKERRRLQYGPLATALVQTQSDTKTIFPAWARVPDMVKGVAALRKLDNLQPFGSTDKDFEAWRNFLRRQLLTQTDVMKEFNHLFPNERKKHAARGAPHS
jgi:hypothetical protein